MIADFANLYPRGRLTYQQTSFLEVTTEVEVHRIDFIGKVTARLRRGTYGEITYATQHTALRLAHATNYHWLNGTFPNFIAQQLITLSQNYQLAITWMPQQYWPTQPRKVAPPFAFFSIGPSYVIAHDFYVSTYVGSAYLVTDNSWR